MTELFIIGFIAMTIVAFTAIGYGFYLTYKLNTFGYSQNDAYEFLKKQRREAGFM
ncbi:TPA: hypothetical protein U1268_001334 [Streptococcus suis]|uniref:hypothetical protein n=1 Tax=Streptococcus suis TaxID=1307 RepID=UPI00040D1AFC|nr:hypothetical protein [Streptococcus suis]HEL1668985.1 hypothetical protein [Streptococcus suis]HEL1754249.1 hypothetical protein [Streptococcus suis]HEM3220542.1 hypothetical protein [Streptococcus suis 2651]HEM5156802.1 hypothetical protein [Streptococcus suis]HEM5167937.1 hypothetical protein [Streptococcus suis]